MLIVVCIKQTLVEYVQLQIATQIRLSYRTVDVTLAYQVKAHLLTKELVFRFLHVMDQEKFLELTVEHVYHALLTKELKDH